MDYKDLHRQTLDDVKEYGAPVLFANESDNAVYDALTETWTGGSETSVAGFAVQVPADPDEFKDLGLVLQTPVTLLFSPTTYGERPGVGTGVTWAGTLFTVRAVHAIAPDGVFIAGRVLVS